jgi:hypothetical protein
MPDVCGTKKASVPQSEGVFYESGHFILRNAAEEAFSNVSIIECMMAF